MSTQLKILKHILIFIVSISVITGYHYFLQHLRLSYPNSINYVFGIVLIVLLICGYLTFNTITRYSYNKYEGLSLLAEITSFIMWGLFFGFPSLYSRYDWAWSYTSISTTTPFLILIGKILIIIGLFGIVFSMIWLGLHRTLGENPKKLIANGPYRYSRNPQLFSCLILIIGFLVVRPSFYNAVWLVLFLFLSKIMISSEEKHLTNLFGDTFTTYCSNTNRWITLWKKR